MQMNDKYKLPQRKSIRLKGYDYSQAGLYFITICTQGRQHLFGQIRARANQRICPQIMTTNHAGKMIHRWYYELENKFTDIKCHEMIIMPNHIHFIVENVGADLCVCSNIGGEPLTNNAGEHVGSPLPNIVQWFKTMTTNEYIRGVKNGIYPPFYKRIWQRNYWEHIIRDENEYMRISQYILANPQKWQNDKLNNGDGNGNIVMEKQLPYNEESWMI